MRVRLKRDRLIAFLARSGLSQNHWAMRLGLSRGHWSEIVNGKYPYLSAKTRQRLLDVLSLPFDELFEIEDRPAGFGEDAFVKALADRYRLDREIAQGGMGTVYLARDLRFARSVAIKVVAPEAISGIGVAQFLKEVRLCARLQHPHILALYDAGDAAGHPFYVTPYVPEGSMRDLLARRRRLSVEFTCRLIRGAALGLQHAHDRRVLHCDIKPENVLVFGEHAYVADFGIARAVHEESHEWGHRRELDASAGTPAYVSPEQASGERNLQPASDTYSLACVAFELLCGRPPFEGTTAAATVAQRFVEEPPHVRTHAPAVPPEVAEVLRSAMAREPQRRPERTLAFAEAMEVASRVRPRPLRRAVRRNVGRVSGLVRTLAFPHVRSRWGWVDAVRQDVAFAVRSLARRPGFAVVVLLTLALGIGANTAVFSVIRGVLLRPLPYPEAGRLVEITGGGAASVPNFLDLRERATSFEQMAAMVVQPATLTGAADPERVWAAAVSADFFPMLRATPQLGRLLTSDDDRPDAEPVAVISDGMWRSRFAADSGVVGTPLQINGGTLTIVGVAERDFGFRGQIEWIPGDPVLWTAFRWRPDRWGRASRFLYLYGRVRSTISMDAAEAELVQLFDQLKQEFPEDNPERWRVGLEPLRSALTDSAARPLWVLGGAVALVLLIACGNVVNLMLVRADGRRGELVLRRALGASRGRVTRQLLTESVVLAVAGGVLGVVLAFGAVQAVVGAFGPFIPRADEIAVDGMVLVFTLGVSVATGLAMGLLSSWTVTRRPIQGSLAIGGRPTVQGHSTMQRGLLVTQVALALMVVVGAGLLLKSLWRLYHTDFGVHADSVLTARLQLPSARYRDASRIKALYDALFADIGRARGVQAVGATTMLPLHGVNNATSIGAPGIPDRTASFVEMRWVTPDYFAAMGIPLVAGRGFIDRDADQTAPPVIINSTLARQLFQNESPLGRRLDVPPYLDPNPEIIGVVGDVRARGLDRVPPPAMYFVGYRSAMSLAVRAEEPAATVSAIRNALRDLDPQLPLFDVMPMAEVVSASVGERRFAALLLAIFAGVAFTLGAVGIYGVMSYTVTQRTREFGIRMALGAGGRDIVRHVLAPGVSLVAVGVALGLGGAFALRRVIAGMLYGVTPEDPWTLAIAVVGLGAAAILASYVPAARAARLDPALPLRVD